MTVLSGENLILHILGGGKVVNTKTDTVYEKGKYGIKKSGNGFKFASIDNYDLKDILVSPDDYEIYHERKEIDLPTALAYIRKDIPVYTESGLHLSRGSSIEILFGGKLYEND